MSSQAETPATSPVDPEEIPSPPFLDPPGVHSQCVIEVAVKTETTINPDYEGEPDVTDPLYADVRFSKWQFRAPCYSVIHKDDDTKLVYMASLQVVLRRFFLGPRLKPSCPELVGYISTPPTSTTPMSSYVVWHNNVHNFGLQFIGIGPLLSAKQRRRFVDDKAWRDLQTACTTQWWWEFGIFMSRSMDGGWPATLEEDEASSESPNSTFTSGPTEEDGEFMANVRKRRKFELADSDSEGGDELASGDQPSPQPNDSPLPVPSTLVPAPLACAGVHFSPGGKGEE